MAGTDNQIIAGLYDVQHIQDRLRKYAQDKEYFRFWVLRQINTISLLKIISEKFGTVPAENLVDYEFKYPEFSELPYSFYLYEISSTTDVTNTKLAVDNETGALLNPSTRLLVEGMFTKSTVTAHTDFATTRNVSTGIVLPEEIRIINVGAEDSHSAGYRIITVRRGHPADSYTGTAPAITTIMKLTVNNLVARSNDFPKPPINKNSSMLSNYIQITRHSYGVGELMTQGGGIDTYLAKGAEFLNISYQLAELYMTKAIERAILTARKSQKTVGGNIEYETGGVLEFIPQDADHYFDFGGKVPSVQRINNMVRRMADTSGIRELWWFTGTQLSEQIANAYENKSIYYTNAQLSVYYHMKIMTLESVGRDMVVHHVTAPILNEIGMANEGIALNLTEYNYNQKNKFGSFQIGYKVAFRDDPDGQDSYKEGEGYKGTWRELYGHWGLVRRLADTQFATIGAAVPNN